MSSTKVKERQGVHLDYYATPSNVVNGLLKTGFADNSHSILEPCAGDGSIVHCILEKYPKAKITAVEIQERFLESLTQTNAQVIIGDFLSRELSSIYDRIIVNPPFSQAEDFIRKCLDLLKPSGKMAFLLRLSFIASVKRFKLFCQYKPSEIHVLSQRPKFGGDNIDSCDYAWIIWQKGSAVYTSLNWIAPN